MYHIQFLDIIVVQTNEDRIVYSGGTLLSRSISDVISLQWYRLIPFYQNLCHV